MNILEKLDISVIQKMMAALTMDLIAGHEPEMTEQDVTIKIPKGIHDVISSISNQFGVDPIEAFNKMANEGISEYLRKAIGQAITPEVAQETREDPMAALKAMGVNLDLTGLQEKLGSLGDLGSKFQEIQGLLNGNNGPTGKNSR